MEDGFGEATAHTAYSDWEELDRIDRTEPDWMIAKYMTWAVLSFGLTFGIDRNGHQSKVDPWIEPPPLRVGWRLRMSLFRASRSRHCIGIALFSRYWWSPSAVCSLFQRVCLRLCDPNIKVFPLS